MGEYYLWTNPSKKQYISDHDERGCGFMFSIASLQRCELTDDACALIAGPWSGDTVAYIGDYFYYGGEYGHNNRRFRDAFGKYPYEIALEEYEELKPDSSGTPHYRFAINETRREFVDRDAGALAAVLELCPGRYGWTRYDPIAPLFSPTWRMDDPVRGRWCFDDVRMSQEQPGDSYQDLSGCFVRWGERVMASDEELRTLVDSDGFANELERRHPGLRGIELVGGVEIVARLLAANRGQPSQTYQVPRHT